MMDNRTMATSTFKEIVSEINDFAAKAVDFASLQEFTVHLIATRLSY